MTTKLHCRKCGGRIGAEVEKCPRCGQPTKHGQAMAVSRVSNRRRAKYFVAAVAVFIAVWLVWRWFV